MEETRMDTAAGPEQAGTGPRLSVDATLGGSFSILKRGPFVFTGLAALPVLLISVVVGLLLAVYLSGGGQSMNNLSVDSLPLESSSASSWLPLSVVGVLFLYGLTNLLVMGATAFGVYRVRLGGRASFGKALGHALSRFLPILGTSLLMSLAFLLPLLGGGLLVGQGFFLGILLLIIPVIILICVWLVTIPACVVEGLGAIDSLKRSAELTRGFRLKIFFIIFLAFILVMIVEAVASGLSVLMFLGQSLAIPIVLRILVFILAQAFWNILISLIYYELRQIKEGVPLDGLSKVFD